MNARLDHDIVLTEYSEEQVETLKRVFNKALVPEGDDYFKLLETEIADQPERMAEIGKAFKQNIQSALSVGSIPFKLVLWGVHTRYYVTQRNASRAHHILTGGTTLTKEMEDEIRAAAHAEAGKLSRAPKGLMDAANTLEAFTEEDAAGSFAQLLYQTLVMIWGSLEILFSDAVKAQLNAQPQLAIRLATQEPARKHFSRTVSMEALASQGFDVKEAMGDIVLGERLLDSLPIIRDAATALFPGNADIHHQLAKPALWLLWQRRNLIVHRRGVVDANYLQRTGDKEAVLHSPLVISGEYIHDVCDLCRDTGIALLRTWRELESQSKPSGCMDAPTQV